MSLSNGAELVFRVKILEYPDVDVIPEDRRQASMEHIILGQTEKIHLMVNNVNAQTKSCRIEFHHGVFAEYPKTEEVDWVI